MKRERASKQAREDMYYKNLAMCIYINMWKQQEREQQQQQQNKKHHDHII